MSESGQAVGVDLDEHGRAAATAYRDRIRHYDDCAAIVERLITKALATDGIAVHSIESRAKAPESLARKASRPAEGDSQQPKYPKPLDDITDLAAVRVITFFLETVDRVIEVVEREFDVLEKANKSTLLSDEQRLGYQSVHLLVRLASNRKQLPEYAAYAETTVEVQVRTILQHAWAEIEHDIQYKSVEALPSGVKQRFMSLAGLLEIADREFQAIAEEDHQVRTDASRLISNGELHKVEISGDALKLYLDKRFGPDLRISDWNYGWQAKALKRLGFENLQQVEDAISPYNHDKVSRAIWGSRQGQLQRFEDVLLAAMGNGERYKTQHPWSTTSFFERWLSTRVALLEKAKIKIGAYDPRRS